MKSTPVSIFLYIVLFLFSSACSKDSLKPDLVLWYNKPASDWNEALPVGNGRMGAMVFGGISEEHLQLNENTLYSGEPSQNYSRF
jgi:alpha-L-fucosidase 2